MTHNTDFQEAALTYKQKDHTTKQTHKPSTPTHKPTTTDKTKNKKPTTQTQKNTTPQKRKINNQKLQQHLQQHPDTHLKETTKQLNTSTPTVCKKLKKLKITRKKKFPPTAKNLPKNEQTF